MTRKIRNLNLETPLAFWLLVAVSTVALTAVVVFLATRTVHADANLRATLPAPAAGSLSHASSPPNELTAPAPPRLQRFKKLRGIASWYGGVFHGRKTASGEAFDANAMTACHPTLPFGSLVRVINLRNHRVVVVRITDRGDLVNDGRVIDLSHAAAEKLAMIHDGLAPVQLEVLSLGKSPISQ